MEMPAECELRPAFFSSGIRKRHRQDKAARARPPVSRLGAPKRCPSPGLPPELFVLFLPDQGRSAEDRGILTLNTARKQLHFILEYEEHALFHVPLRRLEDQLARLRQAAEEEYRLGDVTVTTSASARPSISPVKRKASRAMGSPALQPRRSSKRRNRRKRCRASLLGADILAISSNAVRLMPVAET